MLTIERKKELRKLLKRPVYCGEGRGGKLCYKIDVEGGRALLVDLKDAALLNYVETSVLRFVDNNLGPLIALIGSTDEGLLIAKSWELIDRARADGFSDGALSVTEGGLIFYGLFTGWDDSLFARFDGLLERVAEALVRNEHS